MTGQSGGGGIRTPREIPEETALSNQGGAESGAVTSEIRPIDSNLAHVVSAWPDLPEAIRRAVLALVNTAGR
jgi:hypothetical protein